VHIKQELPDSWDSHDATADGGIGGSALRGASRQAAYSERTMQSLEVPTATTPHAAFRASILHCDDAPETQRAHTAVPGTACSNNIPQVQCLPSMTPLVQAPNANASTNANAHPQL
jgi:hypothetical protein